MIIAVCTARRHGTWWAHRHNGCQCPEAVAAVRAGYADPRTASNIGRRYIRGDAANLFGSRKTPVDDIAVERVIHGDRSIRLTPQERRLAIDWLDRRGWSAARIAEHLGTTTRTVQRQRARRRATQTQEA